ncbi:hypothetical protein V1477_003797 [Vespula maculifrons]|uniref:Uncharacterized protein n=1 Tax=Vespula maculifrons TaxID=7453 RepID=A0ABD2CS30_VESMC
MGTQCKLENIDFVVKERRCALKAQPKGTEDIDCTEKRQYICNVPFVVRLNILRRESTLNANLFREANQLTFSFLNTFFKATCPLLKIRSIS